MSEEHVLGVVGGGPPCAAAGGEQTELVAAVHAREEDILVLEVEQAHQRLRSHNVLKEELRRIVGRDAGREDAPDTPTPVQDAPHPLREDRVGVDVASRTQGIAPGVAHQVAPPLGPAQRHRGTPDRARGHHPQGLGSSASAPPRWARPRSPGSAPRTTPSPEASPAPTADSPARSRSRPHSRPRTPPETPDASERTGISRASRSTSRRCAGARASGSASSPRNVSVVMHIAGSRPAPAPFG